MDRLAVVTIDSVETATPGSKEQTMIYCGDIGEGQREVEFEPLTAPSVPEPIRTPVQEPVTVPVEEPVPA